MAKRGRKPGPGKVQEGSNNARLAAMEVGDYHYFETTPEDYARTMRVVNTPRTRRPAALAGREFTCAAYTAVRTSKVGETKVLVRIERTQ